MGFWLDIYIATKNRDLACIEKFLTAYVNVQVENLRQDFEVWIHNTQKSLAIGTLQNSIELGIKHPDTSFTLYLTAKEANIKSVIIHFGKKGLLIFGLSIEEETGSDKNTGEAERLLAVLKENFNTCSGIIVIEIPPSELEEELENLLC
jgi:hypothetical protein